MRKDGLRQLFRVVVLAASAVVAGCGVVPDARPIAFDSPEVRRVREALAAWPHADADGPVRRHFSATVRLGDLHTHVSGVLEYFGPRDFRVTEEAENGVVFDGRVNWGGAMVLRAGADLDVKAFEALLGDMVRAFDVPTRLAGLEAGATKMVLTRTRPDGYKYTWVFDRGDGRLLETLVDLGFLDTLRVTYGEPAAGGWPGELRLSRFTRSYDVTFVFTDVVPHS